MENERRNFDGGTAEILSRYSVQDLLAQTDADLTVGDERFYKSTADFRITEQGATNYIQWWKIESGDNEYECRRFKNFVYCSCKSFFFSKKLCKHLALTTRVYCAKCFLLSAKVGKHCYDCDMKINHFLPQSRPATFVSSHSL